MRERWTIGALRRLPGLLVGLDAEPIPAEGAA
jgi:hypothetical protein